MILKSAPVVMLATVCLFCSCEEITTTSPQDYIGPAENPKSAEPNLGIPVVTPSAIVNIEPNGPVSITIDEAVIISLGKNKSLVVEKLNPQINRAAEQEAWAVFDPNFSASVSKGKTRRPNSIAGPFDNFPDEITRTTNAQAALSEYFPTGTIVALTGSTSRTEDSLAQEPAVVSSLGASVTQSLLRNFGTTVNLVAVNQAKIDTKISQYELRGFVEQLVADVQKTYWDYALAQKSIEIYRQSLAVAQEQQKQTEEQIRVGTLAASELIAAEAEVALRHQNLIVAENNQVQTGLTLMRLINPGGKDMWNRQIVLKSEPQTPEIELDPVEEHVKTGLKMRPEMNQARLQIDRDELDVVRTRNGLLPQLDFFITMGKTGYADSFSESARDIFNDDNYNVLAGLNLQYPPINRLARAQNRNALLTRQQSQESLDNLAQTVEIDVRSAYLQIISVQQQVAAAIASRKLQEQKLQVETEKFHLGKSTYLLVAQTQRDFLQSQITEIQAIINYRIAIVELYRLEGTLLLRSGIASPGSVPLSTFANNMN